jgi:uncharacterized RDD family membrane protein YckC
VTGGGAGVTVSGVELAGSDNASSERQVAVAAPLGKRLFAMRVVDSSTMRPPGRGQAFWRYGLRSAVVGIGWHPFGGTIFTVGPWPFVCFAPALFDKQWHRGLHDRLAHTVVIDVRGERS